MAECETPRLPTPAAALEYATDAWQRVVLFLDVMRRRAAEYEAHAAEPAPKVVQYRAELILDGRTLPKPVGSLLARVFPPEGVSIDLRERPFVVADSRAGHGPETGELEADSEIGAAMEAGHPAYFIGLLPEPCPGQTILDITAAESTFLKTVVARHPEADGRPCVIGNCQAGLAVTILAALRPGLFGQIIVAGTPLSCWASARGQYPMRYSGGHLGIFVSAGVAAKEDGESASKIGFIGCLPPGLQEAVENPARVASLFGPGLSASRAA